MKVHFRLHQWRQQACYDGDESKSQELKHNSEKPFDLVASGEVTVSNRGDDGEDPV